MIGYRGASRYLSEDFAECFAMECEALRYVREDMGLTNVKLMIPFVRTPAEGKGVIDLLATHGLVRGENDLQVIMMCEIPSNAATPELFLEHFDGFSIGSNDMTQLTLGLDRDSGLVADAFDERDPAVKFMLSRAIEACREAGKYVGICGQGPSDHPDFAQWLMDQGIASMSLNPDTVVDTWLQLAQPRRRRGGLLRTQSSSRTRSSSLVWVPGVLWLSGAGHAGDRGQEEHGVIERLDRVAVMGERLEVAGLQHHGLLAGHLHAAADHLDRSGGRGVVLGQAFAPA